MASYEKNNDCVCALFNCSTLPCVARVQCRLDIVCLDLVTKQISSQYFLIDS